MFSLRNRRILSASQLVRGTVRSLFALLSMSDTQHPLGAAWYGRHRDGGISKFSIGTANPVVKRNYCLRSHLRGLVFTLNHIAVAEDSAIVFVHD